MNPKDSSKSKSQRRRERKQRQQKRIEATQRELRARNAVHIDPPAIDSVIDGTETPAAASPAVQFAKVAESLAPKTPPSLLSRAWKRASTYVPISIGSR